MATVIFFFHGEFGVSASSLIPLTINITTLRPREYKMMQKHSIQCVYNVDIFEKAKQKLIHWQFTVEYDQPFNKRYHLGFCRMIIVK